MTIISVRRPSILILSALALLALPPRGLGQTALAEGASARAADFAAPSAFGSWSVGASAQPMPVSLLTGLQQLIRDRVDPFTAKDVSFAVIPLAGSPAVYFLKRLDPQSLAHRQLAGLLKIPGKSEDFQRRVQKAYDSSDPRQIAALLKDLDDGFESQPVYDAAVKAVRVRAASVLAQYTQSGGKVDAEDFSRTVQEMLPFSSYFMKPGHYEEPLWTLGMMQSQMTRKPREDDATAVEKAVKIGRRIAGKAEENAARVSEDYRVVPSVDASGKTTLYRYDAAANSYIPMANHNPSAEADSLLEAYTDVSRGGGNNHLILSRLQALAAPIGDERLSKTIAQGLVGRMRAPGHWLTGHIGGALESIAVATPHRDVQAVAALGLMDAASAMTPEVNLHRKTRNDVELNYWRWQQFALLDHVRAIALGADADVQTKGLARAFMQRGLDRALEDGDHALAGYYARASDDITRASPAPFSDVPLPESVLPASFWARSESDPRQGDVVMSALAHASGAARERSRRASSSAFWNVAGLLTAMAAISSGGLRAAVTPGPLQAAYAAFAALGFAAFVHFLIAWVRSWGETSAAAAAAARAAARVVSRRSRSV